MTPTLPLRVLSAGSVEPGLVAAARAYEAERGRAVALDWATTPNIRRRVAAGETFDLLILTAAAAEELTAAGSLRKEAHVPIGSVGVGLAVRAGAPVPASIARADDVRAALFAADSVIFTLATSGLYVESMLKREGLYDPLAAKIVRFETGPQMMDHLIASRGNVVCLGAIVELRMFHGRGIQCVGPLPDPMQHRTAYVAARTTRGRDPEGAAGFAAYLAGPQAQRMLCDCGVDPPGA